MCLLRSSLLQVEYSQCTHGYRITPGAVFGCFWRRWRSIEPYKPRRLDHESKFTDFINWALSRNADVATDDKLDDALNDVLKARYAVQLVRQINYGPLESKRYFVFLDGQNGPYAEVSESDLINANFQKLNSFKNFKCDKHNKFFEVNLYQKDPVNKHHWRADIDRPASSINL